MKPGKVDKKRNKHAIMADMKWGNLLERKCPACRRQLKLADGVIGEIVVCPDQTCGFGIGREKFDDVVADMKQQREDRSPDKLREFDDEG